MTAPLLAVENLVVEYPVAHGVFRALDSISFTVDKGSTLAVVGESGCGKSTLAKSLVRLIRPTSGHITFDGADIAVEATRLVEPASLVTPDLLAPGSLLVPYGTVSALDPQLLDVVDKVVVDDWREAQAGEFGALRPHLRSGALTRESLHAEIGDVVTGGRPGREDDDERILFWHRGLSILDVAVGQLILERAKRADLGTMVRFR